MTTEAYIRDPRFEVIGVAAKVNNFPTDWYSGSDHGKFLKSIAYNDKAILCHHTAFDGAILSWHYGIQPKLWLDTLSMSRPKHQTTVGGSLKALAQHYQLGVKGEEVLSALGKRRANFTPQELSRYADYCINDVELTYQLFNKLRKGFPASEIAVIDQTLRMYTEPTIELDTALLREHLNKVRDGKRELLADMGGGASEEAATKVLMSNELFAQYLTKLGVRPPTKTSLRTGKEAWAFSKTDKEFTDLLEHPDECVQTAVAARLGVKSTIEETRTENLIAAAGRGRLPILLNYYGAHTGRFSGGDKLNLQNLPSRNGRNTIRKSLCAPAGQVLVSCDSSQIEARMTAWLAGQEDLVQAFAEGRDVYSEFASEVYGRTITKADSTERFVGKTCILGLGYGMGADKLRRTLELGQGGMKVIIDENEAARIVRLYRQKNYKIAQLWQLCGSVLNDMVAGRSGVINNLIPYDPTGLTLPNKLKITYPQLSPDSSGNGFTYVPDPRAAKREAAGDPSARTKIYGGKVTENIVQALARIVVAEQMVAIGQKYKVVFQVHDEIIIAAPESEADKAQKDIEVCMSTAPSWCSTIPIACESGVAKNYGDC
jgi:DNA polymerase